MFALLTSTILSAAALGFKKSIPDGEAVTNRKNNDKKSAEVKDIVIQQTM